MRAVAIIWCSLIPGLQVYLFRRIYDDLIKNHVEGSKGFRVMLAPWVQAGLCKIVEAEIRFFNGSKIFLCHCEHEKHRFKYQGAEMHVLLVDELTTFTDTIYRFLRTRVRMTSIEVPPAMAGCFPRILTSSNPGNIGHAWVKSAFIMQGDEPVEPMAIRQMDDAEGGMKRQYIPATLEDNPSMQEDDPTYRARIRGIGNEALVKAFERGDWNAVVGSYLEGVWDDEKHVIDPFPIPSTWKVWRSLDWGFAKPYCVLWLALDHDGCYYVWRELYGYGGKADTGSREEAGAVAKKIKMREQHDEKLGYEYRGNVADSAIFAETGAHKSIGQIFRDNGVKWQPCAKGPRSRVIGAQLVVELLRNGKLKVFRTCSHLIRTVPALMPDDNNPEDVNCWVAGTMISTPSGDVPIEQIKDGDCVDTPIGVRRVLQSHVSGKSETVKVVFSDGTVLQGTPNHKIAIRNYGLVPLSELQLLQIPIWKNKGWERNLLYITVLLIHGTKAAATTIRTALTLPKATNPCTVKSGSMQAGKSRLDTIFITSTETLTTTGLITTNALARQNMPIIILQNERNQYAKPLQHGQARQRAGNKSGAMQPRCALIPRKLLLRAAIVEAYLLQGYLTRKIAQSPVGALWKASKRAARFAAKIFGLRDTAKGKYEPVHIVAVGHCAEKTPVFNLTIDEAQLFYANGILSSNTKMEDHAFDALKYGLQSRRANPVDEKQPAEESPGSFDETSDTYTMRV